MSKLEQAAQNYLDMPDTHDGSVRRGYKMNAAAARFRRIYYWKREERLWGGRERLREVAQEIVGREIADD